MRERDPEVSTGPDRYRGVPKKSNSRGATASVTINNWPTHHLLLLFFSFLDFRYRIKPHRSRFSQRRDSGASVSGCKLPVAVPATRRYFVPRPPQMESRREKGIFQFRFLKREPIAKSLGGHEFFFSQFFLFLNLNGWRENISSCLFFFFFVSSVTQFDGAGHVHRPKQK